MATRPVARVNPALRVKQDMLKVFDHFLYGKVAKQLLATEREIVAKNSIMLSSSHIYCSYRGVQYMHDTHVPPRGKIIHLSPELHKEMDAYLKERESVFGYESAVVLGVITQAMNTAKSFNDLYDLLPESVCKPVQKMYGPHSKDMDKLAPEVVEAFITKHKAAIALMKYRMMVNLVT